MNVVSATVLVFVLAACGDDAVTDPVDVQLGETTFVFVVNPTINEATDQPESVPPPGPNQGGVDVAIQDGPPGTTGSDGVAAFAPVDAGTRTVAFDDGDGNTGDLSLEIAERDLQEVVVALDADGPAEMANVLYAFGGEAVEITADMSVTDVNEALSGSNLIVLVRGGTYTGDVHFSGSDVTLFGEGPEGGNVTLDGNVTVSGSGTIALGNAGMAPVEAPSGGC